MQQLVAPIEAEIAQTREILAATRHTLDLLSKTQDAFAKVVVAVGDVFQARNRRLLSHLPLIGIIYRVLAPSTEEESRRGLLDAIHLARTALYEATASVKPGPGFPYSQVNAYLTAPIWPLVEECPAAHLTPAMAKTLEQVATALLAECERASAHIQACSSNAGSSGAPC